MPSQLERAIDRQRRALAARERPAVTAMQRAYRDALRRLDADLLALTARIEQAIAASEPIGEAWLRRDARYRRLIAQTEVQFARFGGDARAILLDAGTVSLAAGAADAAGLLQAVGLTVGPANLPVAATERLVASFAPGSPVGDILASYGTNARRVIERRLVEGVTGGLNPRQVAREIGRELDSPLLRARLLVLTRTEQLRAYREGSRERYAGHADLLRGLRWQAALSDRTCLACLSRSGREYAIEDFPRDQHPCCRCVALPVPRRITVAMPETGTDWLARQPVATQRAMLGPAYDGYRGGGLTLQDFEGSTDSDRWGTTLRERSARDVLRRAA